MLHALPYAGFEQVAAAVTLIERYDEVHRNPAMRRKHISVLRDVILPSYIEFFLSIVSELR